MISPKTKKPAAPVPIMLSVEDAAAMLRCSTYVVYRLLNAKQLPGVRIGGLWRIPKDKLIEWIDQQSRCTA